MTTYNFTTSLGQSLTFDPTADLLSIGYPASDLTIAQNGADVDITVANVGSVKLLSTTIGQLTSLPNGADAANIAVAGGDLLIGDNTNSDAFDALGQTAGLAGGAGSDLIFGMGGGDTITTGATGADVVFGGNGITDTSDGGDNIDIDSTGAVRVYGNAGNDSIDLDATTAAGTVQSVWGGLGDDTTGMDLDADAGADTFAGNFFVSLADGTDSFTTANATAVTGEVTVSGGGGADTITLTNTTGDATVYGGAALADSTDGADVITQGAGNATIYANAGNDTVTLAGKASGTTFVNAGIGNDTITDAAGQGAFTVQGGWGDDAITLDSNNVTSMVVHGGNSATDTADGADTISVTDGGALTSLTLLGNAGNDAISFAGGAATTAAIINGGLGDDTYTLTGIGEAGQDTVALDAGAGNDTFSISFGDEAGANANTSASVNISNFSSDDTLSSLNIDGAAVTAWDVATGSSGIVISSNDDGSVILGGYQGDLDITVGTGKLLANFEGAADTLTGTANVDHLVAGNNGDTLNGAAGADKVIGGTGDDTFLSTIAQIGEADTLTGGNGTDVLSLSDAGAVSNANLADVTEIESVVFTAAGASSLALGNNSGSITTIDGSAVTGGLTITDAGYNTALTITGASGADSVNRSNSTANDTINLGGGGDNVTLGGGDSNVSLGAGVDNLTLETANLTSADTIDGGTGTDVLTVSDAASLVDADFTNVTNLETVTLTNANSQTLVLAAQAQEAGVVTVNGAAVAGANTVNVDASAYSAGIELIGGAGADTLVGGTGDDTITANAGAVAQDTLTGGTGSDTFNFTIAEEDTTVGNVSHITDFTVGAGGDIIDFTNLDTATINDTGADGTVVTIGNGTADAVADTTGIYVATNQFVGTTAANITSGMTASQAAGVLADGDFLYLLFSDGTHSYLAEIEFAGGDAFDGNDETVNFVARFDNVDHTELANITADNFADFA